MHHLNALILVVITCVSCDVFEDAFERSFYKAIIGAEQKLTDKGSFENCGAYYLLFFLLLCQPKCPSANIFACLLQKQTY